MLKNCCAALIRACAVLGILMYFLYTLRFLCSGRTRLKTARNVFQHTAKATAWLLALEPLVTLLAKLALRLSWQSRIGLRTRLKAARNVLQHTAKATGRLLSLEPLVTLFGYLHPNFASRK